MTAVLTVRGNRLPPKETVFDDYGEADAVAHSITKHLSFEGWELADADDVAGWARMEREGDWIEFRLSQTDGKP